LTKDVCKTLDEDTIFKIFSERMRRYLKVSDCKYLKAGTDLTQYQADTLLPLTIQKETVGYLAAGGIKDKDRDKFYILAGQFLIGIQRAVLYQKVQELTITDSLTQVFSRRYFLERLDEEIRRSQNSKLVFSFLMADIDHFKEFNDRYGHLVGDAVLKEVTKTIKENIRQIDFIGRYGGEELSIVLPETDKQESMYVAERIRAAIESKLLVVYDEGLRVTVSIGVSTYPHDASLAKALIDKADQALYLAKQAGRNKVCAS
jgi:diguanylate cyclase (GGDEF)-like protein